MEQVKRDYAVKEVQGMFYDIFYDIWRNRLTGAYNYPWGGVSYESIWLMVEKLFPKYGCRYFDDLQLLVFADLNKYKKYEGLNELEKILVTLLVCLENESDEYMEIILENGVVNGMFYELDYLYMRFILSYNAEDIELYPDDCVEIIE